MERALDPLDNPIWTALTTEQIRFAEIDGDAARFAPAVTALAALRTSDERAGAALARQLAPGEHAGLLLDAPFAPAPPLVVEHDAEVVQMVHDGARVEPPDEPPPDELGTCDVPAMMALAAATRPGPFGPRTAELGPFVGIRANGRLIAMAGQRMRLPGLVEISGVCTDPAHVGRGHAARLMRAQLARIQAAGARAFLHVRADNVRAIALYERLGFRVRRTFRYVIVRTASSVSSD